MYDVHNILLFSRIGMSSEPTKCDRRIIFLFWGKLAGRRDLMVNITHKIK